mmetsp:Transcript_168149/g.540117  ORF Transcript_168149/g.540117 Transcript_168149/m.540117 type:complete len:376 (+) Transcript_168149:2006-3133(+)
MHLDARLGIGSRLRAMGAATDLVELKLPLQSKAIKTTVAAHQREPRALAPKLRSPLEDVLEHRVLCRRVDLAESVVRKPERHARTALWAGSQFDDVRRAMHRDGVDVAWVPRALCRLLLAANRAGLHANRLHLVTIAQERRQPRRGVAGRIAAQEKLHADITCAGQLEVHLHPSGALASSPRRRRQSLEAGRDAIQDRIAHRILPWELVAQEIAGLVPVSRRGRASMELRVPVQGPDQALEQGARRDSRGCRGDPRGLATCTALGTCLIYAPISWVCTWSPGKEQLWSEGTVDPRAVRTGLRQQGEIDDHGQASGKIALGAHGRVHKGRPAILGKCRAVAFVDVTKEVQRRCHAPHMLQELWATSTLGCRCLLSA